MKGVYTAKIRISAVTTAKTLIYITTPSNKVIEILSASITNESNETNEQLIATFQTISSLGSPTGTSLTPSKHEPGDQSATVTAVGNVTANEPTYSSNTEIGIEGFSSLGGWYFDPIPEERPIVAPSSSLGLRLLNAPASSVDLVVKVTFREIG